MLIIQIAAAIFIFKFLDEYCEGIGPFLWGLIQLAFMVGSMVGALFGAYAIFHDGNLWGIVFFLPVIAGGTYAHFKLQTPKELFAPDSNKLSDKTVNK